MPDGQFYGAILWYHLMAPIYGMCVPGFSVLSADWVWLCAAVEVWAVLAWQGDWGEDVWWHWCDADVRRAHRWLRRALVWATQGGRGAAHKAVPLHHVAGSWSADPRQPHHCIPPPRAVVRRISSRNHRRSLQVTNLHCSHNLSYWAMRWTDLTMTSM